MDPARSSLGGGVAATIALLAFLLLADAFFNATNLIVFATFTSLCAVGGPPYCELGSPTAVFLTYLWFVILFAVAWPLLFAGFTWGLPGKSGLAHGAVYGLILWAGYVVIVLFGIGFQQETLRSNFPFLIVTLVAYLIYGLVLGSVYDYLAGHRTFLTGEQAVG